MRDSKCHMISASPADPALDGFVPEALRDAPPGSLFEVSPTGQDVAREIGRRLQAQGGAALVIDYGHEKSALGETLQAVRQHAPHDVLSDPGTADLTCHVDFAALVLAAREAGGVAAHGPVDARGVPGAARHRGAGRTLDGRRHANPTRGHPLPRACA